MRKLRSLIAMFSPLLETVLPSRYISRLLSVYQDVRSDTVAARNGSLEVLKIAKDKF